MDARTRKLESQSGGAQTYCRIDSRKKEKTGRGAEEEAKRREQEEELVNDIVAEDDDF